MGVVAFPSGRTDDAAGLQGAYLLIPSDFRPHLLPSVFLSSIGAEKPAITVIRATAPLGRGDIPRDRWTVVELSGPNGPTDVAATFQTMLGKPVTAISVTLEEFKKTLVGFGLTANLAALYVEMTLALNSRSIAEVKGPIARRAPTRIERVPRKRPGRRSGPERRD